MKYSKSSLAPTLRALRRAFAVVMVVFIRAVSIRAIWLKVRPDLCAKRVIVNGQFKIFERIAYKPVFEPRE